MEVITSRIDARDLRAYNNSSSFSNFALPQNTNRSVRSGNGLINHNNTLNGLSRRETANQYGMEL
jgi:hypothetical protein